LPDLVRSLVSVMLQSLSPHCRRGGAESQWQILCKAHPGAGMEGLSDLREQNFSPQIGHQTRRAGEDLYGYRFPVLEVQRFVRVEKPILAMRVQTFLDYV
jgi:hypothetical protein